MGKVYLTLLLLFLHANIVEMVAMEKIVLRDGSVLQGQISKKQRDFVVLKIGNHSVKIPSQWMQQPGDDGGNNSPELACQTFAALATKGEAVVKKMGKIHSQASVFLLITLVKEDKFSAAAVESLKKLNQIPSVYVSEIMLSSLPPNLQCRHKDRILIKALGKIKSNQAIPFLQSLSRAGDYATQCAAIQALAEINNQESQAFLIESLKLETSKSVCVQIILALGYSGDLKIAPVIFPYLEDKQTMPAAHWSLQKISRQNLPPHRWIWEKWWQEADAAKGR